MKVSYYPTIDFYELRDAIKIQYGADLELCDLFFEYKNDSYESFCFRDIAAEVEDSDEVDIRHLVAYYLSEVLPKQYDMCLILICW